MGPAYCKFIGEFLQGISFDVFHLRSDNFGVKGPREELLAKVHELVLSLGQVLVGQGLDEVSIIEGSVESDPCDFWVQH